MALKELEMQVVHRVPEALEVGFLYICFDCNVVVHLCACGCGEKVVLPIAPDYWSVRYDGETVSLVPSIGNYQFPCKSHYWIKENKVIWADRQAQNITHTKRKQRKSKSFFEKLKALF